MTKFGIIGTTVAAVAGATVVVVPTVVAFTVRNVDPKARMIYDNSINELKEICKIPRTSNEEEVKPDSSNDHLKGIRQHLRNKIKEYMGNDCVIGTDDVGNIWFDIPATPGFENQKPLVLQGHMDMVWHAVGEATKWDPLTHPVSEPVIETVEGKKVMHTKNWLTSLGADDGQYIAIALSLAKYHNKFDHCKIRCLFTVDEETTTIGAKKLGLVNGEYNGFFDDFDYLANIDSPHGGQIITTAAGISHNDHVITIPCAAVQDKYSTTVRLYDFLGGHSGEDIDNGRANPIPLICKELMNVIDSGDFDVQLVSFSSSVEKPNQIPTDVTVKFVSSFSYSIWQKILEHDFAEIKQLYPNETNAKIEITEGEPNPKAISLNHTNTLLEGIPMFPYGVMNEMRFDDGFIGGSGNIAPVSWASDGDNYSLSFHTTFRFGSEEWQDELIDKTDAAKYFLSQPKDWMYQIKEAKVNPVWEEKPNNKLANLCLTSHNNVKLSAELAKCHGALEPSNFSVRKPELFQIAIGPTILNEHNCKEQLFLDDYLHICEVLVQMLQNMNI